METAIILQARLGSKRFPSKVLKKINGKTILEYVINRLKKTKLSKNIIVATTNREEDKKIIKVAKKTNCHTFRGSTNNVLNRYYKAAVHYKVKNIVRICSDCPLIDPKIINKVYSFYLKNNYDYVSNKIIPSYPIGMGVEILNIQSLKKANRLVKNIVRITSDCPLIDPKIINKVYFFYLKNNYDYVSNKIFPSYPPGMGVEILNFQSLKKANKLTKNSYDKEHVTPYIYKNPKKFKIKNVGLKKKLLNYRIVLDYKEDFKLISNILKHFDKQIKDFTLKDIIKYINRNPILKKKNSQNLTKFGYL